MRVVQALVVAILMSALFPLQGIAQAPGGPPKSASPAGDELNEEEIAKDSTTEINVKNADIAAIVRIFGRKTKRNYILDDRVKGKVSIYLPGKVSSEESIRILDSVLAYKGFSAVPIGENLWKIVPAKEAKQSTIPTILDSPEGEPSRSMVTRLVQLQYVSADEVRQLVAQLISPDGFLNAYSGTNSLVLIDTEDNIERIIGIIKTLDIPFSDRDMTIIPIKYADAVDIAAKLNDLLNEGQSQNPAAILHLTYCARVLWRSPSPEGQEVRLNLPVHRLDKMRWPQAEPFNLVRNSRRSRLTNAPILSLSLPTRIPQPESRH